MQDKDKSSATTRKPVLSLHDSLSLGEVELGLATEPSVEEMHRLPTLLRLLSSARPLATVPTFDTEISDGKGAEEDEGDHKDELLDEAVRRLEDRAAVYSVAEGVEVVSCHLAPAMCRKISRLRPLKKGGQSSYDTDTLVEAAISPLQTGAFTSKRRKLTSVVAEAEVEDDDDLHAESDHEDIEMETEDVDIDDKKRRRVSVDNQALSTLQAEDSQEANVTRILSELTSLVVQSLKPPKEEEEGEGGVSSSIDWSISMEHSILAEARQKQAVFESVGGAIVGSDLGANVVSLLHHAPVLRHDHVASALCRATLPQAADLIARMGANAPPAVPTLVRGCIRAYEKASQSKSKNHAIATVARDSIKALANLSDREQSRVRSILRRHNVMIDVQLELAMNRDPLAATCLLIHELSGGSSLPIEERLVCTPESVSDSATKVSKRRSSLVLSSDTVFIKMRSLVCHLSDSPALLLSTLTFIRDELQVLLDGETGADLTVSWARLSLTLSAFSWVLCRVSLEKLLRDGREDVASGRQVLSELFTKLGGIVTRFDKESRRVSCSQDTGPFDRPFYLTLCSVVFAYIAMCSVVSKDKSDIREKSSLNLVKCLGVRSFSKESDVMISAFSYALIDSDPTSLCSVLESVLCKTERLNCRKFARDPFVASMASKGHTFARDEIPYAAFCKLGVSKDAVLVDQSAAILMLQNDVADSTERSRSVRALLSAILEEEEHALKMIRSPACPLFIACAMRILLQDSETRVPLILPIQMEELASKTCLVNRPSIGPPEARFLLGLLYCMEFLDDELDSPFRIDPRCLPLKEVYLICLTLSSELVSDCLAARLRVLIEKYSPEIPLRARAYQLSARSRHVMSSLGKKVAIAESKEQLQRVLRASLAEDAASCSGISVEGVFLLASMELSDADLLTTVAGVLLSYPRRRPPYFSFSMLYRDPLILLKCPLAVFERKGWRRIAVYLLSTLIDINDWVAQQSSKDHDTEVEFISSRNVIVLRCLLSAMLAGVSEFKIQCGMTTGLIRRIVARRSGSVAILLQQLASEDTVDWLVENVPETVEDWKALSQILQERSSLSAVDRLVVADGVLRIAVFQGHRYENEAHSLAFLALSNLIASFSLVLGPVGVPVNTMLNEGTGLDATKTSRKAAFRLIRAMSAVRGYRSRLKNECGLSLQKLAVLCKTDSISGLPGPVAARQKVLLKELLSCIQKAADAMGSGYQI